MFEGLSWYEISAWIVPLILAITLHEAAHGAVAYLFGDATAARLGRVSFNPLKHIDRFGTVILPGLLILTHSPFLFGYAKPVPVRFDQLHPRRLGMVLVALAGPLTNLLLALLSVLCIALMDRFPESHAALEWFYLGCYFSVSINLVLMLFNLFPLLPLDGGRVIAGLLPPRLSRRFARTEKYGMVLLLTLFLFVPLIAGWMGYEGNPFSSLIAGPVDRLRALLFAWTGVGGAG